ncbi:MAG: c-type cytochrome [Gammaproteobacteria bacterium]|nr:c-type cytochrome [Gammaproteobacteria bacterium]
MKFLLTSLVALLLAPVTAALADEFAELTSKCDSCHGPQGVSMHSDMPTIGGQSADYIADSLRNYQVWGRPCIKSAYRHGDTSRPRTDMCKIAGGLSDEDIAALADHYSNLPFVAANQEFDSATAAAGALLHEKHCESCHEEGGKTAGRGPVIAGQWVAYMKSALKFVPTGEHLVPPMMEKTVASFSAEDIEALMSFYASQQN